LTAWRRTYKSARMGGDASEEPSQNGELRSLASVSGLGAEPVDCSACGGTGLSRPRRAGTPDARCPVCDGFGVLPKPECEFP
jgi:DnaJ-class molecular chaperone